jgi:hypothetical protein
MHSPMAGVDGHLAPSAAPPPGQNTDTSVSFASQLSGSNIRVVQSNDAPLLTFRTRIAAAPAEPGGR